MFWFKKGTMESRLDKSIEKFQDTELQKKFEELKAALANASKKDKEIFLPIR